MHRIVCVTTLGVAASVTCAADVTINTFDRGAYRNVFDARQLGFGYNAGANFSTSPFRSYFAFDLPNAPAGKEAVSATLRTFAGGVRAFNDPGSVGIYGWGGSIAALGNGTADFNDFGTGDVFASRTFTTSDSNTFVEFSLNAAGLAAINSSLGSQFAMTARTPETDITFYAFFSTNSTNSTPADGWVQLDITWESAAVIPLPTSAALGGLGLLIVGVRRRRGAGF